MEWLIVAIKEYLFMNETSSSIVMGTVKYWPTWLWVQLTKVSPLTSWPPWFEKRQNWIAKIGAEFITHVSLVLSERERQREKERETETERQRQTERLLAANCTPFSSSKTTCSISATPCWELKSKGVTLVLDKLCFKAHKKFDGSRYLTVLHFC